MTPVPHCVRRAPTNQGSYYKTRIIIYTIASLPIKCFPSKVCFIQSGMIQIFSKCFLAIKKHILLVLLRKKCEVSLITGIFRNKVKKLCYDSIEGKNSTVPI
jgi:hypothetical protein